MKYRFLLILVVVLVEACISKKVQKTNDEFVTYEVEHITDDFFIWDDFVASTKAFPLETTEESLVGSLTNAIVSDDKVIIFDHQYQTLLQFDTTGRFKHRIGRAGRGPNEYLELRDFCFSNNAIYTLDYQKIHVYNTTDGREIDSWRFTVDNTFNPTSFAVFDKSNYYLRDSNPDVLNPSNGDYYLMYKMHNEFVQQKYFKYLSRSFDQSRFSQCSKDAYYSAPLDGEDIVYKINKDSVMRDFMIDFGSMKITEQEALRLKNGKDLNPFIKSNYFKCISHVFEVGNYIYFKCIGPDATNYEGLIDKQTKTAQIGYEDGVKSPTFFYSDGTALYGCYEPAQLLEPLNSSRNNCFNPVWKQFKNINIEDNYIIVKVILK